MLSSTPATPSSASPASTPKRNEECARREVPPDEAVGAEAGEHRHRKRHEEERHAGRANLVHHRHGFVPEPVERRVAAERTNRKRIAMPPSAFTSRPARAVGHAEDGEDHGNGAEVLGVQLEEVAAPVVLEHRR